jgi:hypothetical protein
VLRAAEAARHALGHRHQLAHNDLARALVTTTRPREQERGQTRLGSGAHPTPLSADAASLL